MFIVIDAGHGGRDPGAVSLGGMYQETDNVLAIARAIHGREPKLPGVQFAYTRLKNKHFANTAVEDLAKRVEFANVLKADLFVSIHQNSDAEHVGKGVETYHYHTSGEGQKLAAAVQAAVTQSTGLTDRGIKAGGLYVLRHTNMPAILIEAGFVGGDPQEATAVSTPEMWAKIADGILKGLAAYLGVEYDPKKQNWDQQAEIEQLISAGIINTSREPDKLMTWGEFATVLNRIRREKA